MFVKKKGNSSFTRRRPNPDEMRPERAPRGLPLNSLMVFIVFVFALNSLESVFGVKGVKNYYF